MTGKLKLSTRAALAPLALALTGAFALTLLPVAAEAQSRGPRAAQLQAAKAKAMQGQAAKMRMMQARQGQLAQARQAQAAQAGMATAMVTAATLQATDAGECSPYLAKWMMTRNPLMKAQYEACMED